MKYLILFILYVPLSIHLIAQDCGTIPSNSQQKYINNIEYATTRAMINETQGITDIPIQFHVLRQDNGVGGLTYEFLMEQLIWLNDIYLSANVRFLHPDTIHYIDNSKFYDLEITALGEEDVFANQYDLPNLLNIYCLENLIYAGLAYMPQKSQRLRILMNNIGFEYESTFPHEIGHFFGLYHTHMSSTDPSLNKKIIEPTHREDRDYNGMKDCYETGDYCCDTPADPNIGLSNIKSFISEDCQLTSPISIDGKEYIPQITNLMSYNPNKKCRTELTREQAARVILFVKKERKILRLLKQPTGKIIKGQVKFFLKNKKHMPTALDGVNLYRFDSAYNHKDQFFFEINNETKERIYVSIINMDGKSKKISKVFPYVSYGDKPYIQAKTNFNPLGDSFISLSTISNNISVREYTCFLFSFSPINAEETAQKMQSLSGNFTNRLYKVLGQQLLPLDHVKYMDGDIISFEGTLRENEILPVMVEMKHVY